MEEIWKDIKELENNYQISNLGRIKSKERIIEYCNGKIIHRKEKILSPHNDKDGYKNICISYQNKEHHFKIHRLVAEYFLDNKENYPIVNHKDKNVKNNCVDNLEWCSYSYNNTYANAMDSKRKKVIQCDLEDNPIKEWESIALASKSLNISAGYIVICCKGKKRQAKGYIWKYKEE